MVWQDACTEQQEVLDRRLLFPSWYTISRVLPLSLLFPLLLSLRIWRLSDPLQNKAPRGGAKGAGPVSCLLITTHTRGARGVPTVLSLLLTLSTQHNRPALTFSLGTQTLSLLWKEGGRGGKVPPFSSLYSLVVVCNAGTPLSLSCPRYESSSHHIQVLQGWFF